MGKQGKKNMAFHYTIFIFLVIVGEVEFYDKTISD